MRPALCRQRGRLIQRKPGRQEGGD